MGGMSGPLMSAVSRNGTTEWVTSTSLCFQYTYSVPSVFTPTVTVVSCSATNAIRKHKGEGEGGEEKEGRNKNCRRV